MPTWSSCFQQSHEGNWVFSELAPPILFRNQINKGWITKPMFSWTNCLLTNGVLNEQTFLRLKNRKYFPWSFFTWETRACTILDFQFVQSEQWDPPAWKARTVNLAQELCGIPIGEKPDLFLGLLMEELDLKDWVDCHNLLVCQKWGCWFLFFVERVAQACVFSL